MKHKYIISTNVDGQDVAVLRDDDQVERAKNSMCYRDLFYLSRIGQRVRLGKRYSVRRVSA